MAALDNDEIRVEGAPDRRTLSTDVSIDEDVVDGVLTFRRTGEASAIDEVNSAKIDGLLVPVNFLNDQGDGEDSFISLDLRPVDLEGSELPVEIVYTVDVDDSAAT